MKIKTVFRIYAGFVTALLVSVGRPQSATAGLGNAAPFKAGFTGPQGLVLNGIGVNASAPLLADLNHDGKLEIVVGGALSIDSTYYGTPGAYLTAVDSSGHILWSVQPRPSSEITNGKVQPPIQSSPAVIRDINGDGWDDVVVGLGGLPCCGYNWDGGVAAYSGKTGARLWVFNSDDWLGHVQDGYTDGVFSTPAVGDMFGDGQQEIVFGDWDNCIYMLDRNGNPLWTNKGALPAQNHCKGNHGYYNEDTVWSSPALADLKGDGKREVIIGADVTAGNVYGDPNGGYVLVLDSTGTPIARKWLDEAIFSSPAVGDIDRDGKKEIVIGSGLPYTNAGHYIKAFRYVPNTDITQSLVQVWSAPTLGQVFSSPALADINGDGYLDVIAMSYNGDVTTCSSTSAGGGNRVYALSGLTGLPLWNPVALVNFFGNRDCASFSPVVADINNDGHHKILFNYGWEVSILNSDGSQYTAASTTDNTKPTFNSGCSLAGSPAVGDIDNNGLLDIVVGGSDCGSGSNNRAAIKVWEVNSLNSSVRPWPYFRHDSSRTGFEPIVWNLPNKFWLPILRRG